VFTDDMQVMQWASEPMRIGLRSTMEALVIGPDQVPWVRTAEEAQQLPELAVLSALAHGNEAKGLSVVLAALEAVVGLDAERRGLYYDVVLASLNEATRRALEQEMETRKYEYQSEFARTYFAQGEAKGKAEGKTEGKAEGKAEGETKALLAVLGARGLAVDAETRARIFACTDPGQLEQWIVRAANASSIEEVFEPGS
jgi:flagellar biosynthesis/type III secretory pathway protein FliH